MAKIDEGNMRGLGAYLDEKDAQYGLGNLKNEEVNRSLSIVTSLGLNLIAVAENDKQLRKNSKTRTYTLFVAQPGVGETPSYVTLRVAEVHALISILQGIVEGKSDGINLEIGDGIKGSVRI